MDLWIFFVRRCALPSNFTKFSVSFRCIHCNLQLVIFSQTFSMILVQFNSTLTPTTTMTETTTTMTETTTKLRNYEITTKKREQKKRFNSAVSLLWASYALRQSRICVFDGGLDRRPFANDNYSSTVNEFLITYTDVNWLKSTDRVSTFSLRAGSCCRFAKENRMHSH